MGRFSLPLATVLQLPPEQRPEPRIPADFPLRLCGLGGAL